MKKILLLFLFLTCGMTYAQTASNTITLNGNDYLVVEAPINVSCVGRLEPTPLQPWEHTVLGAGFTSSGTNRLYRRVRGIQTVTIDRSSSGVFFIVESDTEGRFNAPELPNLDALIDYLYPRALAQWEHVVIGAGFTHAAGGTYTRGNGDARSVYYEGDDAGWTVEGPGITRAEQFPATLAQVVTLVYRGR